MKSLLVLLSLLAALPARSAVLLYIAPIGNPTPTVHPGDLLTVDATIGSTVERVVGFDAILSGPVSVVSRTITGPFVDPLTADPTIAGADLGAVVNDVSQPLAAGFYSIARLLLQINPQTSPGVYAVTLAGPTGAGWVDAGFADHAFDGAGSFNINVTGVSTPEPSLFGVALLAAWGMLITRKVK